MSSDHTKQLTNALGLLTSISGRIFQVSDRKAGVALGAASKALVGAAFASAVMGAIGTFGTASTTTAIATLSGAVKTTASLYWIGGMVGSGVAAGTVVWLLQEIGGVSGVGFCHNSSNVSVTPEKDLQGSRKLPFMH